MILHTRHSVKSVKRKQGRSGCVMPVRKSGSGYKYGNKGKTYHGKGAKAKAAKQGRAIQASKHRKGNK
jgi:hypothetical protein